MCGGPLKCGGPCSAEHVRTLVNPALFRAVALSRFITDCPFTVRFTVGQQNVQH